MPQVKNHAFLLALVTALIMGATGCSDPNPNSSFTFEGSHPAGWVPSGHKPAAEADLSSCTECHGSDFSGGIAAVACSDCHLGVSQSEVSVHPLTWTDPTADHSSFVTANGNSSCGIAVCHGVDFLGGSVGIACTDCHLGDESAVHPVSWTVPIVDHGPFVVSDTNAPASCGIAVCHGVDFTGGGVGVSCDQCHNTFPHVAGWAIPTGHGAGARNDILDCKFCHGRSTTPPVYDGDTVGVNCQDCHGTTATGAPHPALWDPIGGQIGTFLHMGRIGNRAGCEECHTDIPGDAGCNFVGCHAGGTNLP